LHQRSSCSFDCNSRSPSRGGTQRMNRHRCVAPLLTGTLG
jgi:hypothetical protein